MSRGADGIRKTMAAYIGLKPHMDVVTHHTTVAGDMEVHRRLPDGTWVFFIDHPFGADPSWAVESPPHTE